MVDLRLLLAACWVWLGLVISYMGWWHWDQYATQDVSKALLMLLAAAGLSTTIYAVVESACFTGRE